MAGPPLLKSMLRRRPLPWLSECVALKPMGAGLKYTSDSNIWESLTTWMTSKYARFVLTSRQLSYLCRFGPLDGPVPNEVTCNYAYLPFGGGKRKCIGDQFALFESVVALSMLMRRYEFSMAPDAPPVSMTTGATIHTTNGLYMSIQPRSQILPSQSLEMQGVSVGAWYFWDLALLVNELRPCIEEAAIQFWWCIDGMSGTCTFELFDCAHFCFLPDLVGNQIRSVVQDMAGPLIGAWFFSVSTVEREIDTHFSLFFYCVVWYDA